MGIGDYHFAGWRPVSAAAAALEAAFNRILFRIVAVKPESDETPARFCKRRNSMIAELKRDHGLCVRTRWALRLISWVEHMYRHPETFAFQLVITQDDEWLRMQRASVGSSIFAGFTRTRAGPGCPLRWGTNWLEAVGEGWWLGERRAGWGADGCRSFSCNRLVEGIQNLVHGAVGCLRSHRYEDIVSELRLK